MISLIRGTLSHVSDGKVEIDTGSLGFEVFVPTSLIPELPPVGEDVELFTHLNVKEDGFSLFGFLTREELELFRKIITVSGIGPKGALAILSVLTPEDLRFAILSSDVKAIAAAPGIGKKTAERLIIELRDSMERSVTEVSYVPARELSGKESGTVSDVVMALTELGFSSKDAYKAVRSIENPPEDEGALLKEALKRLGKSS
jgi:Holliday junction DNA helicase RuvA